MAMQPQHTIRRLHRNRTASLRVPAGTTLLVARGIAWLTSDADARDHMLCHGKEYTARGSEHLVLQALDGTVVYAVRYPTQPQPSFKGEQTWNTLTRPTRAITSTSTTRLTPALR
jgi:hypothetical protein